MSSTTLFFLFLLTSTFYAHCNFLGATNKDDQFTEIIYSLKTLEAYISKYKEEKSSEYSLNHLILSYIREGLYSDSTWTVAGGVVPDDLKQYIKSMDEAKGTNVQSLRKISDIKLPTSDTMDFVHCFAVMNGIEHSNSFTELYANLVGWAGDGAQLFQDISSKTGTLDQLIVEARKLLGVSGGFGEGDLISDLDAISILQIRLLNPTKTFAEIILNYYSSSEYKNRTDNFVNLTFPSLSSHVSKDIFRTTIFDVYQKDTFIQILECTYGLRKKSAFGCYVPGDVVEGLENNQKAAIYAFADYLFENYKQWERKEERGGFLKGWRLGIFIVVFILL